MNINRRRMLDYACAGFAVSYLSGGRVAKPQDPEHAETQWPIAIFEKAFEGLDFDALADAVAATGADGIEATIRPGGHIEPADAADQVPKMVKALQSRGKRVIIAATDIRGTDQPHTERLLKTLRDNGIRNYRLGYYYLDLKRPIQPQVAQASARARGLAALNARLGVQGLYQNHAGGGKRAYLGSLGWDAAMLVRNIDPEALGLAVDTRHLLRDAGSSWPTAAAVCKPYLQAIYVKDGRWTGPRGTQYEDVPLGTGAVTESVFETIRRGVPPMPLCLHVEWIGYRVFAKDEIPTAVAAHRSDVETLKSWINNS